MPCIHTRHSQFQPYFHRTWGGVQWSNQVEEGSDSCVGRCWFGYIVQSPWSSAIKTDANSIKILEEIRKWSWGLHQDMNNEGPIRWASTPVNFTMRQILMERCQLSIWMWRLYIWGMCTLCHLALVATSAPRSVCVNTFSRHSVKMERSMDRDNFLPFLFGSVASIVTWCIEES